MGGDGVKMSEIVHFPCFWCILGLTAWWLRMGTGWICWHRNREQTKAGRLVSPILLDKSKSVEKDRTPGQALVSVLAIRFTGVVQVLRRALCACSG